MISLVDSLCTNLIHAPLPQHRALQSAEHMFSAERRRAFPRIHLSASVLTFLHSRCADCLGVSKNKKMGYPDFTVLLGNIDMTFMTWKWGPHDFGKTCMGMSQVVSRQTSDCVLPVDLSPILARGWDATDHEKQSGYLLCLFLTVDSTDPSAYFTQ